MICKACDFQIQTVLRSNGRKWYLWGWSVVDSEPFHTLIRPGPKFSCLQIIISKETLLFGRVWAYYSARAMQPMLASAQYSWTSRWNQQIRTLKRIWVWSNTMLRLLYTILLSTYLYMCVNIWQIKIGIN